MVVFRHILEHLVEPIKALKKIEELLSATGFLYIALPNVQNPDFKKGMMTSFFRPVHVSYFHVDNVVRLANRSGLKKEGAASEREIYAIFSKKTEDVDLEYENHFLEIQKTLKDSKSKAFSKDIKNMIKIMLSRIMSA